MAKTKVAVIGTGALGSIHAKLYSTISNVELIGLCDINKNRVEKLSKELGVTGFTDFRDIIGKADAASVAVPTKDHFKISKSLLEAGVHLLIEKPITQTLDEANKLLQIAEKKKLTLAVGHIERFNSAIEAIHKIKGDIKFIECHRLGPFVDRIKDVGVVLDLMIHDIDIILDLIKSPIKKIDAVGVKILSKHEDIANARLTFKNGAICNITASRVTNKPMRKIRMFQPNAYISLDYIKQDAVIYTKRLGRISHRQIDIKKENSLLKELKSFIDCVKSGNKPLVSGIEGRNALDIATQVLEKIRK
ncbi:MAG: Gfo/Idh/MocA family oxidoreductase [Candidatus Omnitrophota bacterium]